MPSLPLVAPPATCPKSHTPFALKTSSNSMTSSHSYYPSALFALEGTNTTSYTAVQPEHGTTSTKLIQSKLELDFLPSLGNSSVQGGREPPVAQKPTMPSTSALAVVTNHTEPSAALALRTQSPSTPYRVDEWDRALHAANLSFHFIYIPTGFHNGFLVDFPPISHMQIPPPQQRLLFNIH